MSAPTIDRANKRLMLEWVRGFCADQDANSEGGGPVELSGPWFRVDELENLCHRAYLLGLNDPYGQKTSITLLSGIVRDWVSHLITTARGTGEVCDVEFARFLESVIRSSRCTAVHPVTSEQCRESFNHAGDHCDHDGQGWADV